MRGMLDKDFRQAAQEHLACEIFRRAQGEHVAA